jgi:hypothetical protein
MIKSFDTVKVVQKSTPFGVQLVVGEKYNLRDSQARRRSGSSHGLHPCSRNFTLADIRNRRLTYGSRRFLAEVILMDNTTNYNINDIPQEIRDFLDELLKDGNMTSLDQAMHDEMIVELYTRLDDYMIGTITEQLPKDQLEEFTKMAEDGKNRDELQEYLKSNIPDATNVFAKAMIDFRNLYLGSVDDARDAQAESTQPAPGESNDESKGGNN